MTEIKFKFTVQNVYINVMLVFHWSQPYIRTYDSRSWDHRKKGRKMLSWLRSPQQDGIPTDRSWLLRRQDVRSGMFIAWPVVEVLRQALNP